MTPVPSIGLVKSLGSIADTNGNGKTDAGDTITYNFDVTNTGDLVLDPVAVTDTKITTVTCAATSLAIGGSTTCTGDYVITSADVSAGGVENIATATGTPINPDGSTGTPVTDLSDAGTTPDGSPVVNPETVETPNPLGQNPNDPANPTDDPTTVALTPSSGVVAGTVYEDTNGNGIQDAGEPGIEGVTVTVTDVNGNPYTLTTDENGNYAENVPAGDTIIVIDESTLPSGFTQTQGSPTTTVSVPVGGIANDVDGYEPPATAGTVEGVIYEDTNGNGMQDTGELPLSGVTVIITDSEGGTQTLTTGTDGTYSATVPAGDTIIDIDETTLPGGSTHTDGTDPTTVNVPVDGTATDKDGFQPPANSGEVIGIIYEDTNGNGLQDANEPGLEGVQVEITDSNGNVQTVTTDVDGTYGATVPAGDTTLNVIESTLPGGSTQTDGTDTTTVTVPAGGTATDRDGYEPSLAVGTLNGIVYEDTNGNGTQDANEPGISDVGVTITDSEGNIQTLITDNDGAYSTTVPAGVTLVDIGQGDIDATFTRTEGTDPTTVTVPLNGTATDVDGFAPPTVNPEPPVAVDDEKLDQVVGTSVTLNIVGNDSDPENDLDPTTVKLIDPVTGDKVTTLVVPNEGTWTVDPITGEVTFTPVDGFVGDPTLVDYTVKDKTGLESNTATLTIDYKQEFAKIKGVVWFDAIKNDSHDNGETLLPEWTVVLKDPLGNEVARVQTNSSGSYTIDQVLVGVDYTLEVLSANGILMKVEMVDALVANETKEYELPVDPSGVFYDSQTREPVAGVELEIVNASGTPVDGSCLLSPTQQNQITDADGFYRFDRASGSPHATCPAGSVLVMRVKATPAGYVTGFSTLIPPQAGTFDADSNPANCTFDAIAGGSFCEVQTQPEAPQVGVDPSTRYYTSFVLNMGDRDIINNHIPIDPVNTNLPSDYALVLSKSVNKKQVSVGDQLYYTIIADNTAAGNTAINIDILDNLPAGFKFTGSTAKLVVTGPDAQFDSADYAAATTVTADGAGKDPVRFGVISVPAGQKIQIGYLLKVGTGVRQGNAVNTAQAMSPGTSTPVSNEATATIIVRAESVLDDATLIGKVFHDRDGDGYQDSADVTGIKVRSGKWAKNLGNLTGRVSVLDNPAKHSKTVRVPHTGASQIKVTTKEGSVITINREGRVTESHTGLKAKGLSAQDIRVSVIQLQNATDILITNYGIQEEGIPGVRLATVKGLLIETDGYGRYHIPDVDGGRRGMGKNFILKVDKATLPTGAKFTTENPRVLRLTGAALNKINFGVKLPVQASPYRNQSQPAQYRTETRKTVKTRQVPVYQSVDVNLGSIFFDKDKHNIRRDQRGVMDDIASKIQRYGRGHITIDAFTDSRHNAKYNIALATRRANTVRAELHKRLGSKLMRNVKVDVDKRAYKEVPHNDPRAIDFKKAN